MKRRLKFIGFLALVAVYACNNNTEVKKEVERKKEAIIIKNIVDSIAEANAKQPKGTESAFEKSYNSSLLLFDTPLTEIDVATKYGTAHVIVAGKDDAPPLVLLHGMNATSTMWYPNVKTLAKHFRIYAIDFILEPGKSVRKSSMDNTTEIIDWYSDIFRVLKLKKFYLVGASRGGWLSINIALKHSEKVLKMALLSPAQSFEWMKPKMDLFKNIAYSVSPKRKNLRAALSTMTENIDNINQTYINQYFLATQQASINMSILRMQPFSKSKLKRLNMPILLMVGDHDMINGSHSLSKAQDYVSNITTSIIPHAGHFLSMDQAEMVNNQLVNFLNKK